MKNKAATSPSTYMKTLEVLTRFPILGLLFFLCRFALRCSHLSRHPLAHPPCREGKASNIQPKRKKETKIEEQDPERLTWKSLLSFQILQMVLYSIPGDVSFFSAREQKDNATGDYHI
ncbi:Uncharacterized protein TCM_000953 [Theobroma cacao]|uniref:Uncharacterized protein n=1 Tax=Theobroma cacao TaxID=3641 RepID=A0A061DHI2_THECC|nr:Uncharacterized protein TCM_000953 [Theobroma cacao]